MNNISKHTKCTNCGECCYFVMASTEEIKNIKKYIKSHNINPIKHNEIGKCIFRDEDKKQCLIYQVRPMVCRLFGVVKGMQCVNGNTVELNLRHLVKLDKPQFVNSLKKS